MIQLIQNLKYDPIVAGTNLPTDLIDYSIVKGTLFSTLYNPVEWPGAAAALHALLANNVTAFFEAIASTPTDPTVFPTLGAEVLYGITCSETALKTDNLTALLPLIDEFYATSYISGGSLTSLVLTCPQWLFRAREVYGGDFQVKTKNPLPIIGNTYDPMTPLVSVRNASAGFEGSVLLQHNGYRVNFSPSLPKERGASCGLTSVFLPFSIPLPHSHRYAQARRSETTSWMASCQHREQSASPLCNSLDQITPRRCLNRSLI